MIETVNLTKKYGDLIALDNLNLSIEAGECFGFIGPNGAGASGGFISYAGGCSI